MTDKANGPTIEFPNLEALAQGCMSGNINEWPQLKVEAAKAVALIQSIRSQPVPVEPKEFPHVPAAYINAIAEEGDKREAIEFLQKTWNELCAIRQYTNDLQSALQVAQQERDRHMGAVKAYIEDAEAMKKRAEQAEKDRDNCYASLDAARHRLHEITAFVSGDTNKEWESAHSLQVRRAEQAESERRDLKHALAMANRSADDYMIQKREAESRNKRIVELLKEPNANFSDWLESQMPPGTVISNAKWWAPKIQRAMSAELLREVDNGQ